MNKKILFAAILSGAFLAVQAQTSYAGFNVTYGIPATGNVLGMNSAQNLPANTSSTENVKGSFGSGLTVGSYFGYMFNENLGFDIGINYLWGTKYNFKTDRDYGGGSFDNTTDEVSASSFRISPALRISFGSGKFHPFLRAGMTFGLFNKIVDHSVETSQSPLQTTPDVSDRIFEMTRGNSIGLTGALGVNYSISDNAFIFAELTTYMNNWSPDKGEFTKATLNGADELPSMNISDKQFEFKDKVSSSGSTDVNSPTVSLKTYFPMSSIGFTLGMHFAFGKSK